MGESPRVTQSDFIQSAPDSNGGSYAVHGGISREKSGFHNGVPSQSSSSGTSMDMRGATKPSDFRSHHNSSLSQNFQASSDSQHPESGHDYDTDVMDSPPAYHISTPITMNRQEYLM